MEYKRSMDRKKKSQRTSERLQERIEARRMKMVEMHSDSTTSPTTADTSCGKASQSERGNDEVDSKDS